MHYLAENFLNMRPFIVIFAFLASFLTTFGQVQWPETGMWPESPQAQAIREVMMPTPALLTGACEFSVPLYTIEVEGVQIPLTLQYRSNGVRVGDDPQPIGYGWTLTPPLRVSRQIFGRPDEYFEYSGDLLAYYNCERYPLFYASMRSGTDLLPNTYNKNDYLDPQRDIFTIYLLDKTITLILKDNKFIGVDCDEYIVELLPKDETNSDFAIVVTDPKGLIYNFSVGGETVDGVIMKTEWLLASITLPSGRMIEFDWLINMHSHRGLVTTGIYSVLYNRIGSLCEISNPEDNSMFSYQHRFGNNRDLKGIRFPGGEVSFKYVTKSNIHDLLDSIIVTDCNNTQVTSMSFEQDDLLLKKIVINDSEYIFEYNSGRFDLTNPGCDWWGFYNGKVFDGSYSPKISFITGGDKNDFPPTISEIGGADRTVDEEAMQANILIKAIYPTGGIVEWEYEPHFFRPQISTVDWANDRINEPVLNKGGGLRVKKIIMREKEDDSNPYFRSYTYGPGENGFAEIVAAPFPHTFINEQLLVEGRIIGSVPYLIEDKLLSVNDQSDYLKGQTGTCPIWYSEVTETEPEGKNVYSFKNFCDSNIVKRRWGSIMPEENYTTFSKGPQLIKKSIYKKTASGYKLISEIRNFFSLTKSPELYYTEFLPERLRIQTDNPNTAPDFGLDPYIIFHGRHYGTDFRDPMDAEATTILYRAYSISDWIDITACKVHMQTERLDSCVTVTYTDDNRAIRMSERYEYKPGTSLHKKVTRTNGADVSVTEYIYPTDQNTSVSAMMCDANVVGVPVAVTTSFNGTTQQCVYDMNLYNSNGRVFRPTTIRQRRGSNAFWHTARYNYDEAGNLVEKIGVDSVKTVWHWDSLRIYPEKQIVGGRLISLARWKPLVGVTSLISPAGVEQTFGYDDFGRLTSSLLNGRKLAAYKYNISRHSYSVMSDRYVSASSYVRNTDYFDGLGRVKSRVMQTGRQTFAAVATFYDAMGRPFRTTCPVETGQSSDPQEILTKAQQFYADNSPFATISYEPSPRARKLSEMKAGDKWHNTGKKIRTNLYTNENSGCYRYRITPVGVYVDKPYPQNTLVRETTFDEDGNYVHIIKDMRGLVVRRTDANGSTAFVYDNYGDLRYVLPPGVEKGGGRTSNQMQQLAYWYDYDIHGNCILRKVPGCKEARYKYDPAGRLVAEQSANHAAGEWRLYGYDDCGRQVLAVDCKLTDAEAAEFSEKCRTAALTATDNTSTGGYAFSPPAELAPTLVWARYYDDYAFSAVYPNPSENYFHFSRDVPLSQLATSAAGLLTGIATGAGYEMYFYNKDGREIQRYATGYNVGRRTTTYTYNGEVAKVTYNYPQGVMNPREVVNTYDEIGRLSCSVVKESSRIYLNDDENNYTTITDSAVIRYTYDALGRVVAKQLGSVKSMFTYDLHSWPVQTVTNVANAKITERLMYADGAKPRFNGSISSKITDEGRYDYTYATGGFLTAASYSASDGSDADFSTQYTYDRRGNMLSLTRHGITDHTPDGTEIFGIVDNVSISHTGNQITSLTAESDALPFSGKTGLADNGEFNLAYDASGRLVSDESRGIKSTEYNNDGRPTRVVFDDGHVHENVWDGLGRHIKTRYYIEKAPVFIAGGRDEGSLGGLIGGIGTGVRSLPNSVRTYTGDGHIIRSGARLGTDTLELAAFAGGYFDNLHPYYHVTDYQGNVVAVCNKSGRVIQRASYYPYGELHREPYNPNPRLASPKFPNPYFYTGSERQTANGLNEYAYPARQYVAQVPGFTTVDPKAEEYTQLSPYIMCGGDPINRVDRTGAKFTEDCERAASLLINESIRNLSKDLETYRAVILEIYEMRNSEQLFDVRSCPWLGKYDGTTSYDIGANAVVFSFLNGSSAELSIMAHEFKHGYQFLTGELDLGLIEDTNIGKTTSARNRLFYDKGDEIEAFYRGAAFGGDRFTESDLDNLYLITTEGEKQYLYKNLSKTRLNVYTSPSVFRPMNNEGDKVIERRFKEAQRRRRAVRVNGATYK